MKHDLTQGNILRSIVLFLTIIAFLKQLKPG